MISARQHGRVRNFRVAAKGGRFVYLWHRQAATAPATRDIDVIITDSRGARGQPQQITTTKLFAVCPVRRPKSFGQLHHDVAAGKVRPTVRKAFCAAIGVAQGRRGKMPLERIVDRPKPLKSCAYSCGILFAAGSKADNLHRATAIRGRFTACVLGSNQTTQSLSYDAKRYSSAQTRRFSRLATSASKTSTSR